MGSSASRELTLSVARRHRRVLVLEPSHDGAAKVARKGCGTFRRPLPRPRRARGPRAGEGRLRPRGDGPLRSSSWASLAKPAAGTTLTPTVARAGGATNVVPEVGGARGGRAGLDARGGRARGGGAPRLPARPTRGRRHRRGRLRPPSPRAHDRLRLALRPGPARWPGTWASSSARRGSAAPRTATSPPRPGSRPSTASARAGAARTPATSTCSSRTCRFGRRSSPPSPRSPEARPAPRAPRSATSSGGCVDSRAMKPRPPAILRVASSGLRWLSTWPWKDFRRRRAPTMRRGRRGPRRPRRPGTRAGARTRR